MEPELWDKLARGKCRSETEPSESTSAGDYRIKRQRTVREEAHTVRSSLDQLYRTFPTDRFSYMFPPVVFRHQLYSCLPQKTRTEIDREVNAMRSRKEIRCIKLGFTGDELALVKQDSFREHVRGYARDHLKNPLIIERFLDFVDNFDISISTNDLKKDRAFTDEDIQSLVLVGVLIVREVGTWWLSFPGAGQFMKTFLSGREKVLTMVKKAKYSSVLESELIKRGLPKRCLGMHYTIHDVIGNDLVLVSDTTSGRLLRFRH
ncbi:hypothetical protein RvY_09112 [Ramazzottius varieornatus]|uniref:Serine/threonine-protein kinase 19 n=1 Tax=Ramazzottius varieornatus TaxID=947166 RepID=A0A1D1VDS0_RAMVA|nr:hypothetical protein RvY_09112 [Ramazzottius varieornatus]